MEKEIYIIKNNGERELFDIHKLEESLKRARTDTETTERVIEKIRSELKDEMTTAEIYNRAFEILKQEGKPYAIRYSLRKAIMDLGPSGFPFEKFVAEIFRTKGFETETGVEMLGTCVPHEVDVVAWNPEKLIIVEAKFHNQLGVKSDLKVVLYVKERFDDLSESFFDYGKKRKINEGWLITNTKFSKQAIHYAECKDMKLVGWNYPEKGNLQDLIEEAHLHPITCLESISKNDEQALMQAGIVLCKQAKDNVDIVQQAGITGEKLNKMLEEINLIQSTQN